MSIITDILKEIPLSAVLRERLTDAEAKMAALEKLSADKDGLLRDRDAKIQALELDLKKACEEIERLNQKPQLTAESVEILPSRRLRGLENL